MIVLALFFGVVALLVISALAWRGDARENLRRCSACFYDMSRLDTLTCPECGKVHRSAYQLRQPKRRKRLARNSLAAAAALAITLLFQIRVAEWTSFVPRPVMRGLLYTFVAPAPVDAPPVISGSSNWITPADNGPLSMPDVALRGSRRVWDQLAYHRQVAITIEQWTDLALAPRRGLTLQEIKALIPAANEVRQAFQEWGGSTGTQGWPVQEAKNRLMRRAAAMKQNLVPLAAGEIEFDLGQWALSEVQFQASDYRHRPDWAPPPTALLVACLRSDDPVLNAFAIRRIDGYVRDRALITAEVRALAARAKDPKIVSQAESVLLWLEAFGTSIPETPPVPEGSKP
jgi:hypothetical protein